MAISVTGYSKDGEPRVYGRGVHEGKEVPHEIAERVATAKAQSQATAFHCSKTVSNPIRVCRSRLSR